MEYVENANKGFQSKNSLSLTESVESLETNESAA